MSIFSGFGGEKSDNTKFMPVIRVILFFSGLMKFVLEFCKAQILFPFYITRLTKSKKEKEITLVIYHSEALYIYTYILENINNQQDLFWCLIFLNDDIHNKSNVKKLFV